MPWGAVIGAVGSIAAGAINSGGSGGGNTSTTQSGPPAWVQQNYQQAADLANRVSQQPLQQYQGQMVAGFTPYQLQAMRGVEGAQGIANPYINTAAQYASSAGQPIGVPGQLSGAQMGGLYGAGLGYSNESANANIFGAGREGVNQAYRGVGYGQDAAGAGSRAIGQSVDYGRGAAGFGSRAIGQGVDYGQYNAGRGAAGINHAVGMGSAQDYAHNIQSYMSPYTQSVVNRTQAQFNNQNKQQQQSVVGSAIQQGAYGGDRASVAQGITAGQEQLAQAPVIAGLENQGFTNAQQQLNAQQQFGIQGGQAVGQLGLAAGQLGVQGGQYAGQLGLGAGQLGVQGGQYSGQLGLGAGQLQSQTGLQAGQMGQSAAAQQAALQQQAAQQQFGMFSGQQQAGIGAQEASGWLGANAANIYGALGQQAQSSALTNASALYSMGTAQQQLEQQQLNIPYEQFNAQQAYPYQAAQYRINALEGIGSGAGGTSSTTGPSPNMFSQALGGATAGAGLYNAFGGGGVSPVSGYSVPSSDFLSNQQINSYDPSAYQVPTFARGGRLGRAFGGSAGPQGFAGGGAPALIGGGPLLSGFDRGSRGISHPVLRDPTGQGPKFANWAPIPDNLKSNYAPPPVSSLPYTSTTFPVLNGGTGAPSTVSITPVKGKDGNWSVPASQQPKTPQSTDWQNSLSGLYNHILHHDPTPSGQALYGNIPLIDAEHALYGGQEYKNDIADIIADRSDPAGTKDTDAPGFARGGPAGFRSQYDGGGGIIAQSGASSAGAPIGGGNPVAQGMYQSFAKLPPEKLQELAIRLSPSSPQGQMVRRALQMSHVSPQTQESISQPPMARGGRAAYADGGDASDFGTETPFGGIGSIPAILQSPGAGPTPGLDLGQESSSIFDAIGGNDAAAGKGFTSPLSPLPHKHSGPAGFAAHNAPTIPPPPAAPAAQAVSMSPDVGLSVRNLADAVSSKGSDDGDDSGSISRAMKSPWMALAAAGAGMMASRSPFAGVAIGEGLESGMRFANQQQTEADRRQAQENENLWKNKDIDLRVKQMDQALSEHKDTFGLATKAEADRVQEAQDRELNDKARLGIENSRLGIEAIGANAHVTEANRGYWEPVRALTDPETGKPVTDANGIPQAMWTNRYTGETKQGPAADPSQMGGKSAGTSASQWKYNAWLAAHPDDTDGALDFVAGHKQLSPADAMRYGYEQAAKELSSGQINQSDVDDRAKAVAASISGPSQKAGAPAAAATPAATPGTRVIQNGRIYDSVTHADLGPAP